jgi:DNA-directed RNA polymerase specialized sigma24 family protein
LEKYYKIKAQAIMKNKSAKRMIFEDEFHPEFEDLMQFSFWPARNGRDAVELLREAMAEVYRTWDETMSEENRKMRIYKILAGRLFDGLQNHSRLLTSIPGSNINESPTENDRLLRGAKINVRQNAILTGETEEDINYYRAVAGLPAVFRFAMILSYLEGFSNKKIADLASVKPRAIDLLLNRGRGLLQERLLAYLMGDGDLDMAANMEETLNETEHDD